MHKGLVFDDPEAAAYIEEMGRKVIPEATSWRT